VWLGRTTLYGLAAGGQPGVAHALDILRREIDRTIGLLGVERIADLETSMLVPDRRH
jgi:(S)-mandelate dehydrogenase